ncbi:MAG: NnrS family protein [Rhodocyclaceae bacterium]|nr:NnrS family protein [Rhodocyclaceae bacterium]
MRAPRQETTERRLPYLAQVPFRTFFLIGVLQLLNVVALWLTELGTRAGFWHAPAPPWPPGALHAASLLYGVFPFFVFGFTFNAFPKWHGRNPVAPGLFLAVALLLGTGWLLFYATMLFGAPLEAAFALMLGGWLLGCLTLIEIVRRPGITPWHTRGVMAVVAMGGVGFAMFGHALAGGDGALMQASIGIGVWCYAAPLFFIAAQRVIPMFDGFVVPRLEPYQPVSGLLLACASLVTHGILQIGGLMQWRAAPDAVAALVLWLHVARWPLRAIWSQRVLAMLHSGFIWFAISLTLSALAGFTGLALGGHALYLGAFGSLLFAMATRVTQGRVENKERIEAHAWRLFLVLQSAVILRLAADLLTVEAATLSHLAAAGLFLIAFGAWAALNLHRYLR